ncbi:hypothetical protein [Pseudogemmobacter humi]|uniref:Uncharacterized protein n=1 Tax=Pseudogemmobacter humi TaxID=2483812 RepID=A0A3P5X1I4_9RHOB|nr:hypothetical protein [Pseudogemmobacter humi]VDC27965.1 hypothetical protein XINFAN_01951 [Pseudogemmobacter humi]
MSAEAEAVLGIAGPDEAERGTRFHDLVTGLALTAHATRFGPMAADECTIAFRVKDRQLIREVHGQPPESVDLLLEPAAQMVHQLNRQSAPKEMPLRNAKC